MRKSARILALITAVSAVTGCLGTGIRVSADAPLLRAKDRLTLNADGSCTYFKDGIAQIGRIAVEPNYLLGDVSGDEAVDASDAAQILLISAQSGAAGMDAGELLTESAEHFEDTVQAYAYADVDDDQKIDAGDAAQILIYAAKAGADPNTEPLGTAWFYANEKGALQKGLVTDASGKNTYFAGEDYQLMSGWVTSGEDTYFFTDEGTLCKGMAEIDEELYFFDDQTGKLYTGWITDEDKTHFAYCQDSRVLHDCWIETEDGTFYAGSSYDVLTDYQTINGNLYYFEPIYGNMHRVDIHDDYLIGADGICREIPKGGSGNKTKDAEAVADLIVASLSPEGTDLERVTQAARYVAMFCQNRCTYTMEGKDYSTAYGVFVKGEYSCAGSTRALGLVLTKMGLQWKHVNENQYTHQWCEVTMDGQVGYADGQIGYVGYGSHPLVD